MTATQKVGLACVCIAVAYFTLAAIVALVIGRMIRNADTDPYETEHRADVEKVHDLAARLRNGAP